MKMPLIKFWHWPWWLWVALIGILAMAFFAWPKPAKQIPFEYSRAKIQNLNTTISASGTIVGKDTVDLNFLSGGKLSYISVKAGDTVTKGQIIAGLDTTTLHTALQQAYNTLRDKQATVDKILDDLKNHEKDETYLQRQTRTTAEVARDNAYDSVKSAQKALYDTTLTAPIGGTVTKVGAEAGENVSSSDVIAQITDFSSGIIYEVEVDESDISKVQLGQEATVTLNAYEAKTFKGKVIEIAPATKTTTSGATVVIVKIDLSNAKIAPIHGLNGQAEIIIDQKQDVLTVPLDTVRSDSTVLIKTPNGFRIQKVTTGAKNDTDIEVISGLSEGEEIITNPPSPSPSNRNFNPLRGIFGRFSPNRPNR